MVHPTVGFHVSSDHSINVFATSHLPFENTSPPERKGRARRRSRRFALGNAQGLQDHFTNEADLQVGDQARVGFDGPQFRNHL